jgi:hypothetical protein
MIDQVESFDGFGEVMPLGGGPTANRYTGYGVPEGKTDLLSTQLDLMYNKISGLGGDTISYNFEGLLGPQGPPGPAGPPGIGITSYVGGEVVPVDPNALVSDVPFTNGIVFSQSGANVVWTTGTLRYKGVNYTIAAEATGDANAYIYWDLNSAPTTFKTTATLADTLGADKWAMCYNDSGVPYPTYSNKIIHGGYIEASTIDTVNLNALSITAAKISANAVETTKINGLAVTAGKLGALAVETAKINNEAVTIQGSAYTDGTVSISSGSWTDMETVTFTSTGDPVTVWCELVLEDNSGSTNVDIRVYDGSTVVRSSTQHFSTTAYGIPVYFTFEDTPGSGSVTYQLQASGSGAASECHHIGMIVREVHK